MAIKVLYPRDVLVKRIRGPSTSFIRRNLSPNRNLTILSTDPKQQRKVSPKHDKRRFKATTAAEEEKRSNHGDGIVMGTVTLLRRGESLASLASKDTSGSHNHKDVPVQNSSVLGNISSANTVLKQIRLVSPSPGDVYAGSAFFTSPSPRSVPLPSFFNKKDSENAEGEIIVDDATRDLRRMLRLE